MEELWLKLIGLHHAPGDIPSQFDDGRPCARLYDRITAARLRLCRRFHIDFDDRDLEEILTCSDLICRHISLKLCEYAKNPRAH